MVPWNALETLLKDIKALQWYQRNQERKKAVKQTEKVIIISA